MLGSDQVEFAGDAPGAVPVLAVVPGVAAIVLEEGLEGLPGLLPVRGGVGEDWLGREWSVCHLLEFDC